LARWLASLRNYKYQSDYEYFVKVVHVTLSAFERLGFVAILAFVFVPQWEEVPVLTLRESVDCGDLFMGQSSFTCMQRRLPLSNRRWVFESLLQGPFVVAPFVSIIIKVLIPLVSRQISRACNVFEGYPCCCPFRGVFRITDLIFAYDCGSAGCLNFIAKGDPFPVAEIRPVRCGESNEEWEQAEQLALQEITYALEQAKRRTFEADAEIMEIQMSFLWVAFLFPLKPVGALTTLAAKQLEINCDLVKFFLVRRRPFPKGDKVLRRNMTAFMFSVALGSVGWSACLSMVTYNDDLYHWGAWGYVIVAFMLLWLIFSFLFMFAYKSFRELAAAAIDDTKHVEKE